MEKLKVNEEACIGCGACVAIDPEHFEFNDNGLSVAISQENLETAELTNAIESCPTAAIAKIEVTECDCVNGGVCTCEECECENCNCDEECSCDAINSNECCCDKCECDHCDCHEEA